MTIFLVSPLTCEIHSSVILPAPQRTGGPYTHGLSPALLYGDQNNKGTDVSFLRTHNALPTSKRRRSLGARIFCYPVLETLFARCGTTGRHLVWD